MRGWRGFLGWFALTTAVGMLDVAWAVAGETRPNVVVFLADDAGWGDYGHSGNRQSRTPHIDAIATAGVSLDHFYVCPVCSPTRAEFLTGRYHPRAGVRGVSMGYERMDLRERTLAESLRAAGYATGAFGKWHNGSQWPYHPMARGFDEYLGHTSGHWGEYFDAPLDDAGRMVRTQGYIVDVCTERALDFIERHHARPFFCFIPFTTPHSPWAVPAADWRRWRERPIEQRATRAGDERLEETRCALAMLENQDGNVGRVLRKLEDLNLADNTLVVYFSDNGPNGWRWNGGLKGRKGTTDEGGVRSVCYLRWPARLPARHRVQPITGAIDLLPTLLSLTGTDRVGDLPLDGHDLTPLLMKAAAAWPERLLFSTWAGRISVRTDRHRLDDLGNLYDMRNDPGQATPVQDQLPDVAARLREAAAQWRQEMFGSEPPMEARDRVDPRPIPVGYPEFPVTMLPARDGQPVGNVRRSSSAPNCSYFVNWRSTEDALQWHVDVHAAGTYEVTIDYTCPVADIGSLVELTLGGAKLVARVGPGWDPPLYANQDTLPRPAAESRMKEFREWKPGVLRLERGEGTLTLRALEVPGGSVMDLRRVTLTLLRAASEQ